MQKVAHSFSPHVWVNVHSGMEVQTLSLLPASLSLTHTSSGIYTITGSYIILERNSIWIKKIITLKYLVD